MLKIGLTGGIATGKSYVAKQLRAAGVPVIDADVLAREAVAPGTPGLAAVVRRFGPDVLTADGQLDRARLGDVVFRDEAARRDLEGIIHPVVREGIANFFAHLPPETPFAVADVPLLYETRREDSFDKVVVVASVPMTQIERMLARGLSRTAAEQRLAAQLPIDDKVRRADYVIRTDGTHQETDAQVNRLVTSLRA
jgi:dephospho-CoA kinase